MPLRVKYKIVFGMREIPGEPGLARDFHIKKPPPLEGAEYNNYDSTFILF